MRGDNRETSTERAKRRKHLRAGWLAEHVAALFLMAKGYRILARRFKTRSGEIDLIAKRGKRLAFVEVKQRASDESAEAAIGETQWRRIQSAADDWLARHPAHRNLDMTFDAVFIVKGRLPRHIEQGH